MELRLNSLMYDYCNLILAIEDNTDFNPGWLSFYRVRMMNWIKEMKGNCHNLTEVHNVYCKIQQAWVRNTQKNGK